MVQQYVSKQCIGMPFIINKALLGRCTFTWIHSSISLFDDSTDTTESALGFNIPACSYRGLERPPEVCDPQLHL